MCCIYFKNMFLSFKAKMCYKFICNDHTKPNQESFMPSRQELANAIRALSMDAIQKSNSGHPGAQWGWLISHKYYGLTF